MGHEQSQRPADIPQGLQDDINTALTGFRQRGAESDAVQKVQPDGHLWKIHIYRHNDNTIMIRLVDKGSR